MKKNRIAFLIAIAVSAVLMLSGCGSSYEYITGNVDWDSTYTDGKTINDSFYYSDDWFGESPSKQNDELALASMQLVAAAETDDPDGNGARFLKDMGFDEVGFSDFKSKDPDDCNYTWGRKTLGDETLVAVAIQSHNTDPAIRIKAWRQNATVNDPDQEDPSGEHFAFSKAADKVIDDIASLAGQGSTKYWITGQSRGGAIANILAARLPEKLGDNNGGVFAYTFEAPATADQETSSGGDYKYIHNYVCSDDIVTKIPAWEMTRYGQTYELKTDETDEGLADTLASMGSEAADHKFRIVMDSTVDGLVSNIEKVAPTRADYTASRTDKWSDKDGDHEITYSCQDAITSLMDLAIGDGSSDFKIGDLAGRKSILTAAVEDIAEGIRTENSGGDGSAQYWAAAGVMHGVIEEISGEGGSPVSKESLYTILRVAGPILIDVPEDSSEEPSTELLTNVIGYGDDLAYSHQFDTIIARLKILAPAPQ